MTTAAMVLLAGFVAAGYFTIAAVVAPRIKMPSAGGRTVLVIRVAAIAFFVGCGLTHVHILVHTLGVGGGQPVDSHELAFHVMQAIGAWLFIAGALMRLELHVVPSQRRIGLEAAVAEQRRLAAAATSLAGSDELTGLARRWRFEQELARQVAHARRYDRPGALLLVDVDDFKRVNDTYGHPVGDEVLRSVARTLLDGLRASDLAARIGGDELAIILPETALDDAARTARRLVEAVRAERPEAGPAISISAGVAAIDGVGSPADVIGQADAALYACKRAGGDRAAVTPRPVLAQPGRARGSLASARGSEPS